MPDIVSRIKVEAQGADQAAREIRKLKEAYDQVSAAAKGMSPSSVGGADPFSKATQPNTGVMAGGQSNADVAERETRNRRYQEQSREREQANRQYNAPMRGGGAGQVSGAFSMAEAASRGQGGQVAGGAMSGLGGMLGGPFGMALMAGGAAAFGVQRMAEDAFARLENVFGSGMSQRLGMGYQSVDREMLGFSRMGVPQGMVQQFFQSAGMSGVDFTRGSTQSAVNAAMFGSTIFGMDPSGSAQLIGSLNRANVNASNVMNMGTMGMAQESFGRPDMSTFIQSMTQAVEQATSRGIEMTTEQTLRSGNMIAGLAQFGGMSPQGASAFASTLRGRGRQAAQLNSPEDLIAFQAMRGDDMSVTDTLLAMERNPEEVNRRVFEFLDQQANGDEDYLRWRTQSYLGQGTTMSEVQRFIDTQRGLTGDVETDRLALGGGATAEELGVDEATAKAINIFMVRNNEFLKEMKDGMLDLTTGLGQTMLEMFGRDVPFDPMAMTRSGFDPRLQRDQEDAHSNVQNVDEQTVQEVNILHAVIESAAFEDLERGDRNLMTYLMGRTDSSRSMATAEILQNNPDMGTYLQAVYTNLTGSPSRAIREVLEGGEGALGVGAGGWADIAGDLFDSARRREQEELKEAGMSNRDARRQTNEMAEAIVLALMGMGVTDSMGVLRDVTIEEFDRIIALLQDYFGGPVNTDTGMDN